MLTSESVEKLLPLTGEDKGRGEDVDKSPLFTSKSHTTSLNPSIEGGK